MSLESVKTAMEALEAFVTSIGIIVAGWWSYRLFVRKRESAARAAVSHEIRSL